MLTMTVLMILKIDMFVFLKHFVVGLYSGWFFIIFLKMTQIHEILGTERTLQSVTQLT